MNSKRYLCRGALVGSLVFFLILTMTTTNVMGARLSEQDLYEKAKKEGEVVFYTNIPLKLTEKIAKKFEAKYPGIKCDYVRLGSGALARRIYSELERGIVSPDVISCGITEAFPDWVKKRWLLKSDDLPEWQNIKEELKDKNGYYAGTRITTLGMVYNTKLIKKEAPDSLKELINPKWKGKLVMANPAVAGGALVFVRWVVQHPDLGWKFLEGLRKNKILLLGQHGPVMDAVIRGKAVLAVENQDFRYQGKVKKGATLGFKYPSEGFVVQPQHSAILTNSSHAVAAKLLQNYLMSREVQMIFVREGASTARKDISTEDIKRIHPWKVDISKGWQPEWEKITAKDTGVFIQKVENALVQH